MGILVILKLKLEMNNEGYKKTLEVLFKESAEAQKI